MEVKKTMGLTQDKRLKSFRKKFDPVFNQFAFYYTTWEDRYVWQINYLKF